jgi:hypothetical protein
MARIAQLPELESGTDGAILRAGALRRRDWAPSLTALGGLVAGLALILSMPTGAEALNAFVTPRFNAAGALAAVPSFGPAALAIGGGLLIYAAGLFAPLRSES